MGETRLSSKAQQSGDRARMRRRPPCREFGGDARSAELATRIAAKGRQLSAMQRELFADIAEFDRGECWRGAGAVSMDAWVTEHCGVSSGTARRWVRAACRLESLPRLAEAFAAGALTLDALSPLAEVATPETDADLADAAQGWTVKQARELAQWSRGVSDAAAARRFEQRSCRFDDVRRTMWMALTDDDYASLKSALVGRVAANARCRKKEAGGGVGCDGNGDQLDYVPLDQQLYDAVMQLFGRAFNASGSGPADGTRYRPTVVVHAPLELLLGIDDGGVAEIQGVGPIAPEVARRLACDAHVTFSLERKDGSILDQGRARRDPTAAQRIEIARRDKGCRFPGCTFSDFTQVHHVVHWTNGGSTNLDNLITLCGRHHNAVHELGWKMNGNADEVMTFTGPHGKVMTSVPSPTWRPTRSTVLLRR